MGRKKGSQPDELVPVIGGVEVEFSAIYAAGLKRSGPVLIGHAREPEKVLKKLQAPFDTLVVAWVPDLKLAARIDRRCHRILRKAGRIEGKWCMINCEWAWKVMLVAAQQENIPLYTDADLAAIMRWRSEIAIESLKHAESSFGASWRR